MGNSILLVEDNVGVATVFKFAFAGEGLSFFHACNGKEALDILEKHYQEVGIILLDLRMPVMSGEDFLAEKKNRSNFSETPVIIISGNNNTSEIARKYNITDFIEKTDNDSNVVETIKSLLAKYIDI